MNDADNRLSYPYFPDEPIDTEPDFAQKIFGFEDHIGQYVQKLSDQKGPFTVGILGSWGSGKTSYCKMLAKKLESLEEAERRHVVVRYNPWRYAHMETPVIPLLGVLTQALGKAKFLKRKIRKKILEGFEAILSGMALTAGASNLKLTAKFTNKLWSWLKNLYRSSHEIQAEALWKEYGIFSYQLEKLRDVLAAREKTYGWKGNLYIFIDDLDRCTPEYAIKLLEQIKLFLDLPGVITVLAIHERVLDSYIRKQYREKYDHPDFSIDLYIDKLIQLKIQVPPPKGELSSFVTAILKNENKPALVRQYADTLVPLIVKGAAGNPRSAIRMVNQLIHFAANLGNGSVGKPAFLDRAAFQVIRAAAPGLVEELSHFEIVKDYLDYLHEELDKQRPVTGKMLDFFCLFASREQASMVAALCRECRRAGGPIDWLAAIKTAEKEHHRPVFFKKEQLLAGENQIRLLELLDYYFAWEQVVSSPHLEKNAKLSQRVIRLFTYFDELDNYGDLADFLLQLSKRLLYHITVPKDEYEGLKHEKPWVFKLEYHTFIKLTLSILNKCKRMVFPDDQKETSADLFRSLQLDFLMFNFGFFALRLQKTQGNWDDDNYIKEVLRVFDVHYRAYKTYLVTDLVKTNLFFAYTRRIRDLTAHICNQPTFSLKQKIKYLDGRRLYFNTVIQNMSKGNPILSKLFETDLKTEEVFALPLDPPQN